jgi:2-polyprenyl-3-methyl-5-hydroxy-6-metoxy-1,4-benzoquinol methylase
MKLKLIKNKTISLLRGDYNSVRYRFIMLPKEKAYFYWARVKGLSWIDFYANRLNSYVKQNDYKVMNKNYLNSNINTMKFLKKKGVKKHSEFLDFGCGFFRLGIVLIPYLNKLKYTGIDIAEERVQVGVKILEQVGIKKNEYTSIINKSNTNLNKILKKKFDFIYLESVVTHMPKRDLKELLFSFSKILKKDGSIFLTFIKGDTYKIMGIKDFIYSFSLIKEISAKAGFEAKIDNDWADEKFPMAKLKFKKDKVI